MNQTPSGGKLPQVLIDAKTKLYEDKIKRYKAKSDAFILEANESIQDLINCYFKNFDLEDEAENKYQFDVLNDAWKEYVKGVMQFNSKFIKLDYLAFEKAIEKNMATPEWAEYVRVETLKLNATIPTDEQIYDELFKIRGEEIKALIEPEQIYTIGDEPFLGKDLTDEQIKQLYLTGVIALPFDEPTKAEAQPYEENKSTLTVVD